MERSQKYNINILKLSNKRHHFEFDVDDSFFNSVENSLIQKGSLKAAITLDKSDTMIIAQFDINGVVELTCDRSLDKFDYPLHATERIIFKYADSYEEQTEELITIPFNEEKLELAQHIYDFIGLALPMRKVHPRFNEEEDEEVIIYKTQKEEEIEKDKTVDPRWAALQSLKNKN